MTPTSSEHALAKRRAVNRNARVVMEAGKVGVVLAPNDVQHHRFRTDLVDPVLAFVVYGIPAPQGSKRAYVRGGKAVMKESSAGVDPWRKAVRDVALLAIQDWQHRTGKKWSAINEDVMVKIAITMPSSAAAVRDKRVFCSSVPDLDKLQRAIGDALAPVPLRPSDGDGLGAEIKKQAREKMMQQRRTVCALHDDSRIVTWGDPHKVYPNTTVDSLGFPGVTIEIFRIADLEKVRTCPLIAHPDGRQGMRTTDFIEWARHGSGQPWADVAARLWATHPPQDILNATGTATIHGRTFDDASAVLALKALAVEGPDGFVECVVQKPQAVKNGTPPPRPTKQ